MNENETDKNEKPAETPIDDGPIGIEGFGELLSKLAESNRTFQEEHGELELSHEFKFPMEISKIHHHGMGKYMPFPDVGSLVRIRPVDSDKTHLGLYLGDLAREIMIARGSKSKALMLTERTNPAIWVFDLKKIVWGDSSWWSVISDEKELDKLITDLDIQNVWYVKALKAMCGVEEEVEKDSVECQKCSGHGQTRGLGIGLELPCSDCSGTGNVKGCSSP